MATGTLTPPAEKTLAKPGTQPLKAFELPKYFADEMDRFFSDFAFRWPRPLVRPVGEEIWSPEMEMRQEHGRLLVRVDLPGVMKDAIKVEITETALLIEGERKHDIAKEERGYYRTERSYGRFVRRIPLPEGVEIETAKAKFVNGVLEIVVDVPEVKTPAGRRLPIE
jgi:HSP20 family protein